MSVIIRDHDGKVLHRSTNLRGILDHARRVPVRRVRLYQGFDGTPAYTVEFDNGDWCTGAFADARVMADWFLSRRSWTAEFDIAADVWNVAPRRVSDRVNMRAHGMRSTAAGVAFCI